MLRFMDCQLQLAPPPIHNSFRISILEPLVEELRKLHHVYERIRLVGEAENRIMLRVFLVFKNSGGDEQFIPSRLMVTLLDKIFKAVILHNGIQTRVCFIFHIPSLRIRIIVVTLQKLLLLAVICWLQVEQPLPAVDEDHVSDDVGVADRESKNLPPGGLC